MNPEILEGNRDLNFHLLKQRLIEIIREGNTNEAVRFAYEFLVPHCEEHDDESGTFLRELEEVMGLLAFANTNSNSGDGEGDTSNNSSNGCCSSNGSSSISSSNGMNVDSVGDDDDPGSLLDCCPLMHLLSRKQRQMTAGTSWFLLY